MKRKLNFQNNNVKFHKIYDCAKLPINKYKNRIIEGIKKSDVYIISSTTGSGKTTQIPKYLYQTKLNNNKLIGITQPRTLAAISTAARVAQEMSVPLSDVVGYAVRFDHRCSEQTRLKYMTDGILLQECKNDPKLLDYSIIILDEVHERSLNTELLLGVVKNAQILRSKTENELKIIIMSATIDLDLFKNYFNKESTVKVKVMAVSDVLYPTKILSSQLQIEDYVRQSAKECVNLHIGNVNVADTIPDFLENLGHAILIFLTGEEEISRCCALLNCASKEMIEKGMKGLNVLPLFSALKDELKDKAISGLQMKDARNVIVATNIAETSLTIPGVRVVLDCGKSKQKFVPPPYIMESLQVEWISQAQAEQRAGRSSRLGPGICLRLYNDADYRESMPEEPQSELHGRTSLVSTALLICSLGFHRISSFPWLEKPDYEQMIYSVKILAKIGAVNLIKSKQDVDEENKTKVAEELLVTITDLGKMLLAFPLDPRLALVLVEANKSHKRCLAEAINVVAMLSIVEKLWIHDRCTDMANRMNEFYSPYGDLVSLLLIFKEYEKAQKRHVGANEWCERYNIKLAEMRRAVSIKNQLRKVCNDLKFGNSRNGNYDDLMRCFIIAFPDQQAKLVVDDRPNKFGKKDKKRLNSRSAHYISSSAVVKQNKNEAGNKSNVYKDVLLRLHPSSVLCTSSAPPQDVMYLHCENKNKNRSYIRYLAYIKCEWLTKDTE